MLGEKIKNISNNERLCHRLYNKFGSNGFLIKILKYLINQNACLNKFLYIRVINPEEMEEDSSLLTAFTGHRDGFSSDLVMHSKKTFEKLHIYSLKNYQESPKQETSDHKSFLKSILESHQAQTKMQIESLQNQIEEQKKFIQKFVEERSRKKKQFKLKRGNIFKRRTLSVPAISE